MPHKSIEARNAYHREYKRVRRLNDPEYASKVRAQKKKNYGSIAHSAGEMVRRAILAGKLIRGTVCEFCGISCKTEAAHSDYSKPLLVKWLCVSCHRRWDKESPKQELKL